MKTFAPPQAGTPEPALARAGGPRLHPAGSHLWRVVDGGGRALGHLQQRDEPGGTRFRARRFHAATKTFRDLGDFWSPDDAVDCLRLSR